MENQFRSVEELMKHVEAEAWKRVIKETSERTLGVATILFGIFAIMSASPIMLARVEDVGIHELLAVISGSMWSIVLGIKLYRQSVLT